MSIYLHAFRQWVIHNCGHDEAHRMPRHFITALEVMRQRCPLRSVRIIANDPFRELPVWVYRYFQWLEERIMPGSEPVVMQPNVKYRRYLTPRFPAINFQSLRHPDHIRGATSRMVAILGGDQCAPGSNYDDNFYVALRALIPMVNIQNSVVILTGNAMRPHMAFARKYYSVQGAGPESVYLYYDTLSPAAILRQLARFTARYTKKAEKARKKRAAPATTAESGKKAQLVCPLFRQENPTMPTASPILKIPLLPAAAAPAA